MKKLSSRGYANFINRAKTNSKGQAPEALANTVITSEDSTYAFRLSDFKLAGANARTRVAAVKVSGLPEASQGVIKYYQTKTKSWVALTANQTIELKANDIVKGYLLYEPPKDQFGTGLAKFLYAVSSNGRTFSQKMGAMSIDVKPVNDAPIAKNCAVDVSIGVKQALNINDFKFQDIDNTDYAGVQITKLPGKGLLEVFNVKLNTWEPVKINQVISADDIRAEKLAFTTPVDATNGNYTTLSFKVIDPGSLSSNEATIQLTAYQLKSEISGDDSAVLVEDTNVSPNGFLTAQGSLKVINNNAKADLTFREMKEVATNYGKYTIDQDGEWHYSVNNESQIVQQLARHESLIDTFEVRSKDGTATKTVIIHIAGSNDLATINGTSTGNVTEDVRRVATGTLSVDDRDINERFFQEQTATKSPYGTFSIDKNGAWRFILDNDPKNLAVQSLAKGDTVIDTFKVKSFDNSAEKSISVTITGENDQPVLQGTTKYAPLSAMQPYLEGFRLKDYFQPTDIDKNAMLGFKVFWEGFVELEYYRTAGRMTGEDFYKMEYSTDNGANWSEFTPFSNQYLELDALVRLVPRDQNLIEQGFEHEAWSILSIYAWDKTSLSNSASSQNGRSLIFIQSGFNDTPSLTIDKNLSLGSINANLSDASNDGFLLNDIILKIIKAQPFELTWNERDFSNGVGSIKDMKSAIITNVPYQIYTEYMGLAVTHLDGTYGKWQFSLDGGKNWQDVSNDISETRALLLRSEDKLRYQPTAIAIGAIKHYYADDAAIVIKAWDKSLFYNSGASTTPQYIDTTQESYAVCGENIFSSQLRGDSISNHSITVSDLLEHEGSSALGLALTSLPIIAGTEWKFSLDGGGTWKDISSKNISIHNALLLERGDLLKITGSISEDALLKVYFQEWYMNVGIHGGYLNAAVTSSSSPFSAETITFDLAVSGESPPAVLYAQNLTLSDAMHTCPHILYPEGQHSIIDLGSGDDSGNIPYPITLAVSDVLKLSPDYTIHQLLIDGDANDHVEFNTLDGGYWSAPDNQRININDKSYVKFVGTYQSETVEVLINTMLSNSMSGS